MSSTLAQLKNLIENSEYESADYYTDDDEELEEEPDDLHLRPTYNWNELSNDGFAKKSDEEIEYPVNSEQDSDED